MRTLARYPNYEKAYGPSNIKYLRRTNETIKKANESHPRTLAIRIDLRLPDDEDGIAIAKTDSLCITRGMKSLDEHLKADQKRKKKAGKRVHPCTLRYVWVREFTLNGKKHYHVLLLLNKDAYYHPGDYKKTDGNLASMISESWCSALGLDYPRYKALVHFAKDGVYCLNKNGERYIKTFDELMFRTAYMAKLASKCNEDGERNFGCSQK